MALTKVTFSMIEGAPLSALDFGVVGDGLTDDWPAFKDAVAAAKAQHRMLDISDLKIFLASQDQSIVSDDLFLYGSGYIETYVDFAYQAGTDNFGAHKTAALSKLGSAIFSEYAGPVFTGKTFSGKGFSVFGNITSAGSNGFKQTTPTAYPGWSQALGNCTAVYFANFNQNGFHLLGGLEVCDLIDIHAFQNGGYGLLIEPTVGVNSPIEYFTIQNSSFQWSYFSNISIVGANKHITIENCLLNAPQQLPRRTAGGFTIANYTDVVPCIYFNTANNVSSFTFNFINNHAEGTNGFLILNGDVNYRQQNIVVSGNTVYLDQVSAPYYMVQFSAVQYDFTSRGNIITQGTVYYFPLSAINGECRYMNFLDDATIAPPIVVIGSGATPIYDQQKVPTVKWPTSTGLGQGLAGNVPYTLPTIDTPSNDNRLFAYMYLVTANFRSNAGDGFGAYLVTVTRMPSGNYVGTALAFGSTTGFTGAPSVATNGVLNIPMAANYFLRVSRIDNLPLYVGYPVNLP